MLGNGVVPAVAELAYRTLCGELGIDLKPWVVGYI
jgi:hypothetical protein